MFKLQPVTPRRDLEHPLPEGHPRAMHRSLLSVFTTLALGLACAACASGSNSGARTATQVSSETVGTAGANLVGPSGSTVAVPAGALTGNVTIVVSALAGVRAPRGTAVAAPAIRLEPAGTMFAKPVAVTIPISPSDLNGMSLDDVVVLRSTQNSDVFVPLPTRRAPSGNAVIAITEHFSDFLPVVVTATTSPFGACGDAMCMGTESCSSCPADCGVCVAANICGNGTCETAADEDCGSCNFDCGQCATGVCGDGIIDQAETCDTGFSTGTLLERCSCDDGDPCTADSVLNGNLATCSVTCSHLPATGYGIDTCDDQLPCTVDTITSADALACTVTCTNEPMYQFEWETIACDDMDTCTVDTAASYDPATCAVTGCMNAVIGTCVSACGDGFISGTETCDDGNVFANDGCDASCGLESGYACPTQGAPCYLGACGDGLVSDPETCDDGNTSPFDGCAADCLYTETGFTCDAPGSLCASICGDGLLVGLEECDDGNYNEGDGCDFICVIESGFMCPPTGGMCVPIGGGFCGDAMVVGAEQCDDGNFMFGDGCDQTCAIESGFSCPPAGGMCFPIGGFCGDGVLVGAEVCDDGNGTPGDGCDATCLPEIGYQCPQPGLPCAPFCGDNLMVGSELCDDGPNNGFYGYCDASCTGPGPFCGDGIPQMPQEVCDDGPGGTCADNCQ